jgi:hypothetical protein
MLTDDAMYVHETFGPPAVGTPITWNVPHWSESIEKIRKIAIEHDAFLFPNHDETGVKVSHTHDQITTEFRKIEFQPFSPGYAYE